MAEMIDPPPPQYCAWRPPSDPDRPACGERIVPDHDGGWWHWLPGNVLARRIDRGHGEHDPTPLDGPR